MGRRSIYNGILLALLAAFFLLGIGVWNFQAGHLMVIIFILLSGVLYGLFAFLARCPRCKAPVLLRPFSVFGMEFYVWSIVMPRRCRHCGEALS
jgi:hypothetical protein